MSKQLKRYTDSKWDDIIFSQDSIDSTSGWITTIQNDLVALSKMALNYTNLINKPDNELVAELPSKPHNDRIYILKHPLQIEDDLSNITLTKSCISNVNKTSNGYALAKDGLAIGELRWYQGNFIIDSATTDWYKFNQDKTEITFIKNIKVQSIYVENPSNQIYKTPITAYAHNQDYGWKSLSGSSEGGSIGPVGPAGPAGPAGNTWKPTVDVSGNLSWAIDTSETQPTSRNIRGPQGSKGVRGSFWFSGIIEPNLDLYPDLMIHDHYLNTTTGKIYKLVDDPSGAAWTEENSIKGADGNNGFTWKPSVTAQGFLSWTKDSSETQPESRNIKGADGITPIIGNNGNWFIGSNDTGKPSRGIQGEAGSVADIINAGNGNVITSLTLGTDKKITATKSFTAASQSWVTQQGYVTNSKNAFSYNNLSNKPTIPSTDNMVTTNTEQTISAIKTFSNNVIFDANRSFKIKLAFIPYTSAGGYYILGDANSDNNTKSVLNIDASQGAYFINPKGELSPNNFYNDGGDLYVATSGSGLGVTLKADSFQDFYVANKDDNAHTIVGADTDSPCIIKKLTQTEYNALSVKDENTLYLIVG